MTGNAPLKNRLDQLTRLEKLSLGQIGRTKTHRKDWKPSRQLMRLREVEKVIRSRHGGKIPDPLDTDDREFCLNYILAAALSKVEEQCMTSWCAKWAPWASTAEIVNAEIQAAKRKMMITADGVAGLLMITFSERTSIGLNTIGACDIPRHQRNKLAKERKQRRDRERQEQLRRNRGSKDRKSHAASTITHLKPWIAEGISRATWYRKQRETEQSRVVIYTSGDTFVSPTSKASISLHSGQGEAEHECVGLGDHPPTEFQEAAPHGSDFDCDAIPEMRRNAA